MARMLNDPFPSFGMGDLRFLPVITSHVKNIEIKKLEKPKGFIARKLSSSLDNQIDSIASAIEERAMWQKYGL